METVLVSACLLGMACRYDGQARHTVIPSNCRVVPFCPETAGGLGIPRLPAEIVGGDGAAVWAGYARVINKAGQDVTYAYQAGAQAALCLCREKGIMRAVLKSRSPSCSCSAIYDGTWRGRLQPGVGVTTALLQKHGITVTEAG